MANIASFNSEITEIVENVEKAVVSINSTMASGVFEYGTGQLKGSGSGFIVKGNGYILTNNHVVQNAELVEVKLSDGRKYKGNVIGSDPQTDLAVISIDEKNLPVLSLGDSEKIKTGSLVLAIGNALGLPGGHTVSMGVISAKNRPMPWADFIFEGMIQTDAAINPGNSGGPLVDLNGFAIGINTAIIPQANGIGFSIPSNTAIKVMDELINTGHVHRQYIGISGIGITEEIARRYGLQHENGVMVVRIGIESPAYSAGIRANDIISNFGVYEIRTVKDLIAAIAKSCGSIDVTFYRGNSKYRTVVEMPGKKPGKLVKIL
ncbi:MAG: trypsin-like peptidase domain-containing protein [Ferroplasma sp.]